MSYGERFWDKVVCTLGAVLFFGIIGFVFFFTIRWAWSYDVGKLLLGVVGGLVVGAVAMFYGTVVYFSRR